jgi:hypothetical protein
MIGKQDLSNAGRGFSQPKFELIRLNSATAFHPDREWGQSLTRAPLKFKEAYKRGSICNNRLLGPGQ